MMDENDIVIGEASGYFIRILFVIASIVKGFIYLLPLVWFIGQTYWGMQDAYIALILWNLLFVGIIWVARYLDTMPTYEDMTEIIVEDAVALMTYRAMVDSK